MAFVVYMTFRTSAVILKIGEMASQFSLQCFMEFGYCGVHFSVTWSSATKAFFSSRASDRLSSDILLMFFCLYQIHILEYFLPDGQYNVGILSLDRRQQ